MAFKVARPQERSLTLTALVRWQKTFVVCPQMGTQVTSGTERVPTDVTAIALRLWTSPTFYHHSCLSLSWLLCLRGYWHHFLDNWWLWLVQNLCNRSLSLHFHFCRRGFIIQQFVCRHRSQYTTASTPLSNYMQKTAVNAQRTTPDCLLLLVNIQLCSLQWRRPHQQL